MQFILKNYEITARCIEQIKQSAGKSVTIGSPKRSSPQNRLWHNLIGIIADYMGEDPEALKLMIKDKCLGREVIEVMGEKYIEVRHSSSLNVKEMNELIDHTYTIGAQLGVQLPSPDYWGLE